MSGMTSGDEAPTLATGLTTTYARAEGLLLSDTDATAAVQRLALVARDMVDTSVGAGASLLDESGRRTSAATTDRIATRADALQYELGEGPCLSAWAARSVQHVQDTATEERWRDWCTRVGELGVRSVLSAPMVFKDLALGALKVYSTQRQAFGVADEHRLLLLADAAATLLGASQDTAAARRLSEGVQGVLADRQAVETATGVLMERHHLDLATARRRLMDQSRRRGVAMAQLAREVLAGAGGPPS